MGQRMINSFFARLLVAAINVATLVLCARYLGVSSRGEISIFLFGISLIQMSGEVFSGYAVVHFMPTINHSTMIRYGYLFIFLASLLASGLLFLSDKMLPGLALETWIIALLVLLHTFHCIIVLGRENVFLFNRLSILQPLLLFIGIFCAIFIAKQFTFKAYLYPLLWSFILAIPFSGKFAFQHKLKVVTQPFPLKAVLINGFRYQAVLLMHFFCIRYTYFLLPNSGDVGLYASGTAIAESALLLSGSLAPLILSEVANNQSQNRNVQRTVKLSLLGFAFSMCTLSILIIIPERWLLFVLGSGFVGIKSVCVYYAPAVAMLSLFIPLSQFFSAKGQQMRTLIAYSSGFLFTLVAAPALTAKFGIIGAAVNADISLFLVATGMILFFLKDNRIVWKDLFSQASLLSK